MPSPQMLSSMTQSAEHPSASMTLPSSHCSLSSMIPLPHTCAGCAVNVHCSVQSVLASHSSPESTMPSPQMGGEHVLRHASGVVFEFPSPSSHVSPNSASMIPSPHTGKVHDVRHALAVTSELFSALSQSSFGSTFALPQSEGAKASFAACTAPDAVAIDNANDADADETDFALIFLSISSVTRVTSAGHRSWN